MNISMLYAHWKGEPWSFPMSVKAELVRRGHFIRDYNMYRLNGEFAYKGEQRKYGDDGINDMINDARFGLFVPDVVLAMDYGPFHSARYVRENIPNAIWVFEAGDLPQSWGNQWDKACNSDIVLSPDKICTELYRKQGINAHWWTHCADDNLYKPYPDEPILYDAVTTCGPRGPKGQITSNIKDALGDRFFNERYFWGEEYARILNRGKLVFQCSQFKEMSRRIFEGMLSGKAVITDRLRPGTGMEDLFIDGTDIILYDEAEDCIDKIRYYSEHDEERERIAQNGFAKAKQYHTVKARIDTLELLIAEIKK